MITFSISFKLTFLNGPRGLPKNLPDSIILEVCVFGNFFVVDELFGKAYEVLAFIYQLVIICYLFQFLYDLM